ncbi:MAG: flavodoxin family protein [Legionellales bacterium]|nr:flavodoxin family protein [Legionellales bacterium]
MDNNIQSRPLILGISGSLRNSRFGAGSEKLCSELKEIATKDELISYIDAQAKIRLDDFFNAGRAQGEAFDKIYDNLRRSRNDRGLSNSEIGLAAALWAAYHHGMDITHLGLSRYFPDVGEPRHLDELREFILTADALILSGPVYFGDRGSLIGSFIRFLQTDETCKNHLKNKIYAGIAVGAKRNGGQETTLIYQLYDMTQLGMLAVGNDSDTTAQYGGTIQAGDVGFASRDMYGIDTALGVGRRVADVLTLQNLPTPPHSLPKKTKIALWLLEDDIKQQGDTLTQQLIQEFTQDDQIEFVYHNFTQANIRRCIACDLCPTEFAEKENYRCIIQTKHDLFTQMHSEIVNVDAIILVAFCPKNQNERVTTYQKFIERTRYLRRDNYVFDNLLATALVIEELGGSRGLQIRMLTSLLRHHTILHDVLRAYSHEGQLFRWNELIDSAKNFAAQAKILTAKRETQEQSHRNVYYNPVGYKISAERFHEQLEKFSPSQSTIEPFDLKIKT